jgi:nucleoside-diphosphate-sugar epimerase
MITGGTGFIGYHTALALMAAGHEVSLLVRNPDKMRRVFGRGVIKHYTRGDIADATAVRKAMRDCQAVIHVAALVSTHAADEERVYQTNLEGTHNVIGGAVEAGMEHIIHVSSVTALFNPKARRLDEDSPPGTSKGGYGRSKVACEKYARSLQDQGYPVTITYPATVLGPDTPEMTEAHTGLQTYVSRFIPLMTSGAQYVDVRDIADVHLAIIEGRAPSNRYVLGGHYVPWRKLGRVLHSVTGRWPIQLPISSALMRLGGRLADRLGGLLPDDIPVTAEGMTYATRWVPMDNSRVEEDLDFQFRPVEETFADSIRWLYEEGHITARQAGRLAE